MGALSEYRIYPGNGSLFIRRDGKPIFLGSSKAYSLTMQRKKPAKLVWTQAWRRLHKKASQKSELRTKQKAAALKEVKARKTAGKTKVAGRNGSSSGAGQRAKLPKSVMKNNRSR